MPGLSHFQSVRKRPWRNRANFLLWNGIRSCVNGIMESGISIRECRRQPIISYHWWRNWWTDMTSMASSSTISVIRSRQRLFRTRRSIRNMENLPVCPIGAVRISIRWYIAFMTGSNRQSPGFRSAVRRWVNTTVSNGFPMPDGRRMKVFSRILKCGWRKGNRIWSFRWCTTCTIIFSRLWTTGWKIVTGVWLSRDWGLTGWINPKQTGRLMTLRIR